MKLILDHTQRLHLSVLVGNLECRTVGQTRDAWQLMDIFALDQDEKLAIDLRVQVINGIEAYAWDLSKSIPVREFFVDDSDVQILSRALAACPRFFPMQARRWLEPLLKQLPELEEDSTNGHNTTPGTPIRSITNGTGRELNQTQG